MKINIKISVHAVVLFLLACFYVTARIAAILQNGDQYVLYKDPRQPVEARVEDLLRRMSLREKIGQMMQVERKDLTAEIVKEFGVGSILSGGGSWPCQNATAEEWIRMVNEFQKGAVSTRLGIPVFYGIDAIHGNNNVYNATIFPHNVGLGATRDPDLVKRIGAATALEVRATGMQYAFAPCIAVCRDPRWGRCYESFSEDHNVVQQMTEHITGLQGDIPADKPKGYPYIGGKTKVMGSAKHYVGDGGTVNGINENDTVVSWEELLSIHMPAYPDAIQKGVATVMVSYSSWNGLKMHANHDLVTDYLKGKLGFKGIVISDYEGIDRITSPPHANYTFSIQASVLAGLDMIMLPYNYAEFSNVLTSLVKKKVIPMSRIDDAVSRILRVKFIAGLFESPMSDKSFVSYLGSKEHRELAREAARKSLVLLRNGKSLATPMLPLPRKGGEVLVAGSHADDLGNQCGGWTITWQGQAGNNMTRGTTILGGIRATIDPSTKIVYKKNPDADFVKSRKFDYAIVVVGESPTAETKGDNLNLTIPAEGLSTIKNVCDKVKCVVILISGRPLVIEPILPSVEAFVAAWLPGSEGQGVADVLYGDYGFSGKLPRTWFRRVDQLPMNFGDTDYDPLFPFGFGLQTNAVGVRDK